MLKKTRANDTGKNTFHPNCINWSYLKRGNVVLTQINKINKNNIFIIKNINEKQGADQPPKKTKTIKVDIRIILAYSAKKNKAKLIPEYSTLYPETNSASASGKSKGALLVSANAEIKNKINEPKCGTINQTSS